jgi:hypothetical protein
MTTEEKIKASIRKAIDNERGQLLGFASAQTKWGQQLDLTPPPLMLVVYRDGTVSSASRPLRFTPDGLDLGRDDLTEKERGRLDEQWDAALVQAEEFKRPEMVIVVHAATALVELRKGPAFDAPGKG